MVHGIPCFDLPVTNTARTGPPEASLFDRVKLNKSLRDRKYLKISSPILLHPEGDHRAPEPVEKDEKYVSGSARVQPLPVEILEFDSRYTVRDLSPRFTSFGTQKHRAETAPDTSSGGGSPRGKQIYAGVTHIPEDLPCHERYVPLVRSRSTRTLEEQKFWGRGTEVEDEEDGWSESSSVYSRENFDGDNYLAASGYVR